MSTEESTNPLVIETVQYRAPRRLSKRLVPVRRNGAPNVPAGRNTLSTVELLTQQLQDKSNQLASTQEQLAESKRSFAMFTNSISHDLGAPLRAISGFSQYLKEEYEEQLDETANQYIKFVVDGSLRMEQLITGLVRYSRVKSEALHGDIVDLNESYEDAITGLQKQIREVGAVVTCATLPKVRGDFVQLTFLLQSLIENALKFNDSATPTIHIESQQLENDWAISVRDNGIGIANENLECVFDIFRQLSPKQEFNGVGAGLAICQRIAEHHCGNVSLKSEEGNGTLAVISLPILDAGHNS
ncbi:ATP-binding protein [bacterium]|nr:ATP-binding protein [bacterium]